MRRIFTIIVALLCSITMMAQPSPVKKAAKSIIKVTTFSADGNILSTGYGAFVDADGTAIAAWTPFKGAYKAVVIDGQGKKYDVESIYGASSIYNIIKFKVKVEEKSTIVPLKQETSSQAVGTEAWCVLYDVKKPTFVKLPSVKVESFMNDKPYYIYEQADRLIDEKHIGAPFLNAEGQLMGLTNTSNTRTDLYVASSLFAETLQPTAFSSNDNTLRETNIRIALAKDYSQAMLAMMLASQRNDTINFPQTIDEFITMFPDKEDGYTQKANYLLGVGDLAGADKAMEKALEVTSQKDNILYFYSKLIYNKETLLSSLNSEGWTLDNSLDKINQAIEINPLPLYRVHKGKVLYSQKKFNESLTEFEEVAKTDFRDADVFFFAFQCMKNIGTEQTKQLEMLDSAIVLNQKEMLYKAEKALLLMKMNKPQDAIMVCQEMIATAPRYAEGHGLLGLALCMYGKKEVGIAELKRAKALGYYQADAFLRKYGADSKE